MKSRLNFSLNIEHSAASKLSVKAAYSGHRGSVSFVLSIVREWPESFPPKRLLKDSRMPRCCQFSEDRKEPSAGRSRSATDKLGDTARAENWRHPEGANSLGHLGRVRGPFPSRASLLSYSPLRGCSFVASPISTPKSSRVTCVSSSTVS